MYSLFLWFSQNTRRSYGGTNRRANPLVEMLAVTKNRWKMLFERTLSNKASKQVSAAYGFAGVMRTDRPTDGWIDRVTNGPSKRFKESRSRD